MDQLNIPGFNWLIPLWIVAVGAVSMVVISRQRSALDNLAVLSRVQRILQDAGIKEPRLYGSASLSTIVHMARHRIAHRDRPDGTTLLRQIGDEAGALRRTQTAGRSPLQQRLARLREHLPLARLLEQIGANPRLEAAETAAHSRRIEVEAGARAAKLPRSRDGEEDL